MAVKQILMLGNPELYKVSVDVKKEDLTEISGIVTDLHDTLMDFRNRFGVGRAIAAPQIGVFKKIIYMNIDNPLVLINPVLREQSPEMIEIWDDCLSFPDLLVKVLRHRSCKIDYLDREWKSCSMSLQDDLSELLQHECDHLDGILAVQRAIDGKSFAIRSQTKNLH